MVNVGFAVARLASPSKDRSCDMVPPPKSPKRPVSTRPSKTGHSASKAAPVTTSPTSKRHNIKISIAPAREAPTLTSSPRMRGEPPPSSPSRPIGARPKPKPIGIKRTPSEARLSRLQASSLKTVSPEQQRRGSFISPRSLAVGDDQHRSECSRSPGKQRRSSNSGNNSSNATKSSKSSNEKQTSFRDLAARNKQKEGYNKQAQFQNPTEIFAEEPRKKVEEDASSWVIDVKPTARLSKKQNFDSIGWGSPSRKTANKTRLTDHDKSFPEIEYMGDSFCTTYEDPFAPVPKTEKKTTEAVKSPRKKKSSSPRRTRRELDPRSIGSSSSKTKNILPTLDLCGDYEHDVRSAVTATTKQSSSSNGSCDCKESNNSPYKLPPALDSPIKDSRKPGANKTRSQRRASMGDTSLSDHTRERRRERRSSLNMMRTAKQPSLDLSMSSNSCQRSARNSHHPSRSYEFPKS